MSESSYEKIYARLLQTKTGKEEVERLRSALNSIDVTGYEFREATEGGKFAAEVTWISTGPNYEKKFMKIGDSDVRYGFKGQLIEADTIVDHHFGRHGDVKTMNCKRDVVTGVKNHEKHDSFKSWFGNQFSGIFESEIKAARERMTAKIQEITASSEFAERKTAFIKDRALDAIRNTMQRYQFLGDQFLSDSIRDYVAYSILES